MRNIMLYFDCNKMVPLCQYERVKGNPEKRKLNQQKVAFDLHITREALSYYENGKREPPFDLLNRVSDYFHVSIDYLINGKEFEDK